MFKVMVAVLSERLDDQLITRYTFRGAKSETTPTLKPEDPDKSVRVLLAEDNAINQKLAVRLLQKLGVTVDVAGNGKEALQMSGMFDYDLILMDCQMPEMDGYEATRQIRARENGGRVPIVALTANAMKGDREKCVDAGMDDHVTKPIRHGALKKVLDTHIAA